MMGRGNITADNEKYSSSPLVTFGWDYVSDKLLAIRNNVRKAVGLTVHALSLGEHAERGGYSRKMTQIPTSTSDETQSLEEFGIAIRMLSILRRRSLCCL